MVFVHPKEGVISGYLNLPEQEYAQFPQKQLSISQL